MSVIVAISGGKASAWCAGWALKKYPKEDVILYFNDTKWEHPDLYRFLDDLSKYFNHPITYDSDGRTPEQLFYDNNALANNRMPFCSRILKAERLQKYYKDGDILVFGIGADVRVWLSSQRLRRGKNRQIASYIIASYYRIKTIIRKNKSFIKKIICFVIKNKEN